MIISKWRLLKMLNEVEFEKQIVKFYHACGLSNREIDNVLKKNRNQISTYLVATPELMARKFYEWTYGKKLN